MNGDEKLAGARARSTRATSSDAGRSESKSENGEDATPSKEREKNTLPASASMSNSTRPLPPSKCPLFCCFYAEFDNVLGPTVRFQAPNDLMHQDMEISVDRIHDLLQCAFMNPPKEDTTQASRVPSESESRTTASMKTGTPPSPGIGEEASDERLSIFDATSEYIITGKELAGKMINLSTHSVHILTRPEVIHHERYQRNNLLFCVGFVLRRQADPRPFRPILAKVAQTLTVMERETQALTKQPHKFLPRLLHRLLVSLNSPKGESTLLWNENNLVGLQLFAPPTTTIRQSRLEGSGSHNPRIMALPSMDHRKRTTLPPPDHAVPVLKRPSALMVPEWDLAINWVVLHMDGIQTTKQIAQRSEVDLEMVKACLQVLEHHDVIGLIDVFFYTNRYECTSQDMDSKVLQQAVEYCRRNPKAAQTSSSAAPDELPEDSAVVGSLANNQHSLSSPGSNASWWNAGNSFTQQRTAEFTTARSATLARREQKRIEGAVADLYSSFHRKISVGELLVEKLASSATAEQDVERARNNNGTATSNNDTSRMSPEARSRTTRTGGGNKQPRGDAATCSDARKSASNGSIKSNPKKSEVIDWSTVIPLLDPRRFVTFGVLNGWIRRVHMYPLLVGPTITMPSIRTTRPMPFLVERVASKMNGRTSDDELMCEFERPIEELLDLVEAQTEQRVCRIYC